MLAVTEQLNIPVALLLTRTGKIIKATDESTTFAAIEKGAILGAEETDITDPYGEQSWPICSYSYFLIPRTYTRTTCSGRREMITFMKW